MPDGFEVVEDDCIGCALCSERAPENFEMPSGSQTALVFKQPETPEEEQACLDACEYCPMGGIQERVADSSRAVSAADTTRPTHSTSIPAVKATPVGINQPRLEN